MLPVLFDPLSLQGQWVEVSNSISKQAKCSPDIGEKQGSFFNKVIYTGGPRCILIF